MIIQLSNSFPSQKISNKTRLRTDPRVYLFSTFILITGCILTEQAGWLQFGAIALLLLTNIIFSGQALKLFVMRLFKIYPMIFLMSIMYLFNRPAETTTIPLFTSGSMTIYMDGFISFLDLNIRSLLIVSSSFFMIFSVPFEHVLQALERFRMPDWIEAILIHMHRFIYLIADEFSRIHMAYKSRAVSVTFFRKVEIVVHVTGVYLTRLIERSEKTHLSMISKGFSGRIHSLNTLCWQGSDSLRLSINFGITLMIVVFL